MMASMVATFGVAIVFDRHVVFLGPDPRILKPPYAGSSIFIGEIAISQGPLIGFIMAALRHCSCLLVSPSHLYRKRCAGHMAESDEGIGRDKSGNVSLITFALSIASAGIAGVAMAMIYAFYPSVQSVWTMFVFLVTIVGVVGTSSAEAWQAC